MTDANPRPLVGRRTIVVGGSTGIGRGVADAWAAAGAEVVVCSRSEPTGPGAELLSWERVDLTETGLARERLTALGAGRVDAVCFSSIYYGERRALFGDVAEREWRAQLEINVTGLWLTLAATLPALRAAAPGLFVGVSSEVVFNAGPGRSGYTASKAAAKALLDSVAREEQDTQRVRVVQILPAGMVDSPGIRRRRPPDFDYSDYMVPADFARVARELAVTAGEKYHGDSLVVDGAGDWRSAYDELPVSQSRPVPS
jgi:NAD(P)-dependent dehydrogenase (short-subunit alcohol dehydrogenase family)